MKKIIWLVVAIVIILIVIISVSNRADSPTSAASTIKIGALESINAGTASSYGEFAQRGIALALEDLNAVEGAKKIVVDMQDSQGQAKAAVPAFNKFVSEGTKFVIGDIVGGVTLSVAPIAEQNQVIYVTPGSSVPTVSQAGDYIFRTKVSSAIESKAVTSHLTDVLKIKSAAILNQNSQYGKGVHDAMKTELSARNIPITAEETFEAGSVDFKTQLSKIKQGNPDIIVLTGFPKEIGQIMKQAKELGITKKFIAHSGSVGPDISKVAGAAADGLLALLETSPDMNQAGTKSFYDRHQSHYGVEPEVFTLLTYDTLMLLGKQVRACNEDVQCVKKGLYGLNEQGITGPISFDKNGDIVRNSFTLFTYKDGKLVRAN